MVLKNTAVKTGFGKGIVSNHVKSHANDPLVVKKVDEAEMTLRRVGLPFQKKKE